MVNALLCKVQLSVGNINHTCLARYFDIFHIYLKFKGCSYSVEWHCSAHCPVLSLLPCLWYSICSLLRGLYVGDWEKMTVNNTGKKTIGVWWSLCSTGRLCWRKHEAVGFLSVCWFPSAPDKGEDYCLQALGVNGCPPQWHGTAILGRVHVVQCHTETHISAEKMVLKKSRFCFSPCH